MRLSPHVTMLSAMSVEENFIYGHHPLYQHDLPIDAGLFDHRVRAALFKAKMRATILRATKTAN